MSLFNVDLPPEFRFTESTPEGRNRELEDYLRALDTSLEETLRRLFNMLSDPSKIKTGTYTGDGTTSQAITNIGFRPLFVKITKRETVSGTEEASFWTTDKIVDDNAAGGAIKDDNDEHKFVVNAIISLDADGFTVDDGGADANPNTDGVIYNYVVVG